MLFGNCTDLAQIAKGNTKPYLSIVESGFDYAEVQLAQVADLTEAQFNEVCAFVEKNPIPLRACNCMFPGEIRLVGPEVNDAQIAEYLEMAFARMKRMGADRVVLGSGKAREVPDGYDMEQAYDEFSAMLRRVVVPACEKFGVLVLIEPLRNPPVNFINTLADGMKVVRKVDSKWVQLLADTIHMMSSGEDPEEICAYSENMQHFHISDVARALPEEGYSPRLTELLAALKKSGYDGMISFEAAAPTQPDGLAKALQLLKKTMAE